MIILICTPGIRSVWSCHGWIQESLAKSCELASCLLIGFNRKRSDSPLATIREGRDASGRTNRPGGDESGRQLRDSRIFQGMNARSGGPARERKMTS